MVQLGIFTALYKGTRLTLGSVLLKNKRPVDTPISASIWNAKLAGDFYPTLTGPFSLNLAHNARGTRTSGCAECR